MIKSKIKLEVEKIAKRSTDILGGFVGCVMLVPIIAVVCISKLINKEKGPIFYAQERIGKNGKLFKMYKFRSMVVGADEILVEYLANNKEAAEEYKINKKLKDDPRITKTGKFIRRTSLDEFPQFINVLKGEMSLVGPRPYLPREKEDMGEYYTYIVECKPGVTGLWQVSGRSGVTFNDRLKIDYTYCNSKSFLHDCKLIKRTVENVIKKEGAI
jgi:undecaprenyl-phosphate galactose phosphotransferase